MEKNVEMTLIGAAQAQLLAHHQVRQRVDVEFACHLQRVGVRGCFSHLNKTLEAMVREPLPERRGDDDCHFGRILGSRVRTLWIRSRDRAFCKQRATRARRPETVSVCGKQMGNFAFLRRGVGLLQVF